MTAPTLPSTLPVSKQAALDDLIDELAQRLQRGGEVDVDALVQAHPELAEELRKLVPAMQVLAELNRSAPANFARAGGDATNDTGLGVLGDFRLFREVGRGGMGIVYEAEQMSLRRRVALKILPLASMLDPHQLQRFRNEAAAAACLHHTNIVPVFATGAERGVHFYAMQFIEGQTLADVIADWRLRIADCKQEPTDADSIRNPQSEIRNSTLQALTTQRTKNAPAFYRTVAALGIQAAEAGFNVHSSRVRLGKGIPVCVRRKRMLEEQEGLRANRLHP